MKKLVSVLGLVSLLGLSNIASASPRMPDDTQEATDASKNEMQLLLLLLLMAS